jgi:hypothetical protein
VSPSQVRRAASSAVGLWYQADPVRNNLSRDNVHLERDGLETSRQKLNPVRTCRERQRLGTAAERTRDAYVMVIDVDKGVGWSDGETDSALLGFRWGVIRRDRKSVRRLPIAVRVPPVLQVRIVRVGIAPTPEVRIVVEVSTGKIAMVVAMIEMMTMIVIEVSAMVAVIEMVTMIMMITAASVALYRVGIGMGSGLSAGRRFRCALRVSPGRALRVSAACALRVSAAHRVSSAHPAAHVPDTAAARVPATAAALREQG